MKASLSKMKNQVQRGFTLVEIAIVLVIVGLLVGGVLRGQELINSARVRNILDQQTSIQTAYTSFLDRFKAIPGDMSAAQAALINGAAAAASASSDGAVGLADSPAFFNNLAQAGFISCAACMTVSTANAGAGAYAAATTLSIANSPANIFAQPMAFIYNPATPAAVAADGAINAFANVVEGGKPLLATGSGIASNMLAEMDRKQDDGDPSRGSFRYTDIVGGSLTLGSGYAASTQRALCSTVAAAGTASTWVVTPVAQCQGANLF